MTKAKNRCLGNTCIQEKENKRDPEDTRRGQRAERRTKMLHGSQGRMISSRIPVAYLGLQMKANQNELFSKFIFQMFRTLKITEHPVLQGETKLGTMQKATGFGTSW